MKPEQRLMVAFLLIAGILAVWSALLPPQRLPDQKAALETHTGTPAATLIGKPGDSAEQFNFGRHILGVGKERCGLATLKVDGEPLLEQAAPGLLEIWWGQLNPQPVKLQTRTENGKLISEGFVADGLQIRRIIQPEANHPYRFQCIVELLNPTQQSQRTYLHLVVYRTLYSSDPTHRQAGGNLLLDGKTVNISVKRGQEKRFSGTPDWISSHGKSHASIVSVPGKQGVFHVEHPLGSEPVGVLELPSQEIPAGGKREWNFPLYIGPMALGTLKEAGLEEALSFGAFSGVSRWLLGFLDKGYNLLHNYGLAIILLSVAVWLPFSPLTWYGRWVSQKTMKRMAEVRPQEARIRKEHKNNPDQMHRELMQLYRKQGVNPASGCIGCLPFLFTWPIYIALFGVLTRAPELRGASFLWIRDLAAPDAIIPLPFNFPFVGSHLNILPVLATVGTYLQQSMMQPPVMEMSEEQQAQQQMMKFFPLIFLFVFYQLPSGFMLYWVVNTSLTVFQQLAADRFAKRRA